MYDRTLYFVCKAVDSSNMKYYWTKYFVVHEYMFISMSDIHCMRKYFLAIILRRTTCKILIRSPGQQCCLMANIFFSCFVITSGSRTGAIHHHDVRVANHHVATLARHTQEVCGLKWSPDGKYLASGGNDNLLMIWDAGVNITNNTNTPVYTFNQHQAAVKVCNHSFTTLPFFLT